MIKHLGKHMEGPKKMTKVLEEVCEGCEKAKSEGLPFPASNCRVENP